MISFFSLREFSYHITRKHCELNFSRQDFVDQELSLEKATKNLLFIRVCYLDLSFTLEAPFSPLFSSSL